MSLGDKNGYVYPSDKSWVMTMRQHYAGLAMTKMLEKYSVFFYR